MNKLAAEEKFERTGEKVKVPINILSINSKTLDVYKIPLEYLYYNDENGRLAASIDMDTIMKPAKDDENPEYNKIIENIIIDNNPKSIKKTMENIEKEGQKVNGWILDDGRVIDGNRRFTALRNIQRKTGQTQFFEAVILPKIESKDAEKRIIKQLELALQLGVEKKLEYSSVDMAIDIYQTTTGKNSNMSLEDYARSANLSKKEIRDYYNAAVYINEFLDFIGSPNSYKIIKDAKIYALFDEMGKTLEKNFDSSDDAQVQKNETMKTYFGLILYQLHVGIENNTGRNRLRDYRRYIINTSRNNEFNEEVDEIIDDIAESIEEKEIKNSVDLSSALSKENEKIVEFQKKYERQLASAKSGQNINEFIKKFDDMVDFLEEVKKGNGLLGNLHYGDVSQEQLNRLMDLTRSISLNSKEIFEVYGKESE